MDYQLSADAAFARLGAEVMKVQLLEERVLVLETAIQIATGSLTLDENGIDFDLMAAASAELDRLKATSSPEPPPPDRDPSRQQTGPTEP